MLTINHHALYPHKAIKKLLDKQEETLLYMPLIKFSISGMTQNVDDISNIFQVLQDKQSEIQVQISLTLLGIICYNLHPKYDGKEH